MSLVVVVVFLVVFAAVCFAIALSYSFVQSQNQKKVRGRLDGPSVGSRPSKTVVLMRAEESRDALSLLLDRLDLGTKLERAISQSGMTTTPLRLAAISIALALVGAIIGFRIQGGGTFGINVVLLATAGVSIPILFVWRRRKKRLAQFEAQLPDALDFIARSMRAGHGLAISIELLAADAPEPLASDFRRVASEVTLGSSLESALLRLGEQVPLVDVRFFTSAVSLQQQTGGNLSEILGKLAHMIRERFRIKADVRGVTAHGRMTALALFFLPVVVGLLLHFMNPAYLDKFAMEPEGRALLIGAACGEVIGNLIVWRMVNFKI
jgi:tight adherence protein B